MTVYELIALIFN